MGPKGKLYTAKPYWFPVKSIEVNNKESPKQIRKGDITKSANRNSLHVLSMWLFAMSKKYNFCFCYYCSFYFSLYFYVETYTDASIFPLFACLHLSLTAPSFCPSPHCCLCLWVMHACSLANPFTFFHPDSLPPSLWCLLVCSKCPCLCFYFICQFNFTVIF